MEPIKFKEVNKTYAEDQPEYTPIPGHYIDNAKGEFIFLEKATWKERLKFLFTGKIWVAVLTFGEPLQPMMFTMYKHDVFLRDKHFMWVRRKGLLYIRFFGFGLMMHDIDAPGRRKIFGKYFRFFKPSDLVS